MIFRTAMIVGLTASTLASFLHSGEQLPDYPIAGQLEQRPGIMVQVQPEVAEEDERSAQAQAVAYTSEDVAALARIVYWEARSEPDIGKLAVANVVLNRVKNQKWPNTIQKVIAQKNQFTPYRNGRYFSVEVDETCYEVARMALEGQKAIPDDYTYFACGKQRRYAKDFIKIGGHYFGRCK